MMTRDVPAGLQSKHAEWERHFAAWLKTQPDVELMLSPRKYRQCTGTMIGWKQQVQRNRELYKQAQARYDDELHK